MLVSQINNCSTLCGPLFPHLLPPLAAAVSSCFLRLYGLPATLNCPSSVNCNFDIQSLQEMPFKFDFFFGNLDTWEETTDLAEYASC